MEENAWVQIQREHIKDWREMAESSKSLLDFYKYITRQFDPCDHEFLLTRYMQRNGVWRAYLQCTKCYEAGNNNGLKNPSNLMSLPIRVERDWQQWESIRNQIVAEAKSIIVESQKYIQERQAFERDALYRNYIQSAEWKTRSQMVRERCKGICEGCGQRPFFAAHHLTYEHLGNEFLFELVGLCKECHTRWHFNPPAFDVTGRSSYWSLGAARMKTFEF